MTEIIAAAVAINLGIESIEMFTVNKKYDIATK